MKIRIPMSYPFNPPSLEFKSIASAFKFKTRAAGSLGVRTYNGFGHITVKTGSPYSVARHSVTEFFVNEDARGKGIGKAFVQEIVRKYRNDIAAQVSSEASLRVFYSLGFRPVEDFNLTLQNTLKLFKDNWCSLLLLYRKRTSPLPIR